MHPDLNQLKEFLPLLLPLVIAQITLLAITLKHILSHDNYKRGTRTLWLIVTIIGMEFIGPIIYFAFGKGEE